MSKFMLWLGFLTLAFGTAWEPVATLHHHNLLGAVAGGLIGFGSSTPALEFGKLNTKTNVTINNSGRDNPYYD